MKKKILTKQILLALAMAGLVPAGQAWAEQTYTIDGDKLTIHTDSTVGPNSTFDGANLSDFKTVEIFFDSDADEKRALGVFSARYDLSDTDIIVHVEGDGENNDGVHLSNWNPHFEANSFTVYVDSPISDAINLSHDATTSYATINDLKAEVHQGNGIRANAPYRENETNTITINKSTDITIWGDGNTAVWAGDSKAYFIIGGETKGEGKVYLKGDTQVTLYGENDRGIWAGKNGNIEAENVEITANGADSYGIRASNENIIYGALFDQSKNIHGSSVTLNGDKNIIYMAEGGTAIYAASQYGIVKSGENGIGWFNFLGNVEAENGGLIDLHATGNQSYLQGDVKAYGTESGKSAAVNLSVDNALAGQGTIAAANGGIVNLSLGAGSSWAGRADDYQDAANADWAASHAAAIENAFDGKTISSNGTVNLTLGQNAMWNVTGQSWVSSLQGNDSLIFLDGDNTGGHSLHIGELSGENTFIMNVRPDETGDMLYVKNGTSDTQHLVINNRDEVLENMDVGDAVRFATVASAGNGFPSDGVSDTAGISTFGRSTRINGAGLFNVDFAIEYHDYGEAVDGDAAGTDVDTANDAYNGGAGTDTDGKNILEEQKPGTAYVDNVYGSKDGAQNVYLVRQANSMDNVSDAGKTVIAMSKVNYSNAVYMDRLNKRMGEARYIDGDDGLWVRLRHDRIGKDDAFRSMNTMFELGWDWHAKGQKDGEHRQGVAFDYMRGTADYKNVAGDGDVRRAGVWLYDTWLGDKGHYSDYVVKYGRLSNDFDIYSELGEKISGDYDNDVWSVSAEYGRKKDIGNDWYFEPQVQAQYAYVTSADYTTSQGTKVNLDSIDSLIGRAGFRLGRDTSEGNTVYFKADVLHEFLGDQSIRAHDATGTLSTTYENEGTWYDVGFGFAHKMGKDSYVFLDVEHSFGNDNDDTYQINIGLNHAF